MTFVAAMLWKRILEIEPTVLAEEKVIRKTDDVPHHNRYRRQLDLANKGAGVVV